jgi:hypothetical protein
MNARIVAFIASRLFAIYLLLVYVLNYALVLIVSLISAQAEIGKNTLAYAGSLTFAAIFSGLIAAAFWFGAGWIADRIVSASPAVDDEGLNIDQWKRLVVAAIGALFILTAAKFFSQTLNLLVRHDPDFGSLSLFTLISGGLYAVAGISLIAWSRSIAGGLKALITWFAKPAFGENDR